MSSRALRRLREEKEAAAISEENDGSEEDDDTSDDDEDGNGGGGGNKAFLMMLEEESSEEDSSSEDGEDSDTEQEERERMTKAAAAAKKNKQQQAQQKESEEDLDVILSDIKIQTPDDASSTIDSPDDATNKTLRSILLSDKNGYEVSHLDLDNAVRNLVGGAAAAVGNPMDDGMPNQPQNQRGGRGNKNRGKRTTLAKKYLFGRPKSEWGKPPSYVGGGLGVQELTKEVLKEERISWSTPWPYDLISNGADDDMTKDGIPMIPQSRQKWYSLHMSDTYQEQQYAYQQMVSSLSANHHNHLHGINDPNALAMFVADHPYFADTVLQLAMVLYYVNDRGRGNDLLRRCMFIYETALPSSVLPNNNNNNNEKNATSQRCDILIDIDRQPNSGLFSTLFRIMQTSGMTGCYENALAVGRFLISLDPLRDPMGVLLILDYYALACRKSTAASLGGDRAVELGAAFIVQLVESELVSSVHTCCCMFTFHCAQPNLFINVSIQINIHYKYPLTDRHHWCPLLDMPSWAFSYALALYRLANNETGVDDDTLKDKANEALSSALSRFPMVLSKLLTMNSVNLQDRSFRMDWPTVLQHFSGDAFDSAGESGRETVEGRVAGELLVRIFVQRCHTLWKGDETVQWLYSCADKIVKGRQSESESMVNTTTTDAKGGATSDTPQSVIFPPLATSFSPALARYAQCDPSEYGDRFQTFPPEAINLDPNIVAHAMAFDPNRRGRFLRGGQHRAHAVGGMGGGPQQIPLDGALLDQLRGLIGGDIGAQEMENLDPDSPVMQLFLQSLLPWARVEGVRPPGR